MRTSLRQLTYLATRYKKTVLMCLLGFALFITHAHPQSYPQEDPHSAAIVKRDREILLQKKRFDAMMVGSLLTIVAMGVSFGILFFYTYKVKTQQNYELRKDLADYKEKLFEANRQLEELENQLV